MNSLPMILRFCSGSVTPSSLSRKRSEASTPMTSKAETVAQHFQRVGKFVFPEHAGVDEDVREPVAHGAMDQDCGYRGVHSPAQSADGPLVADFFSNGCGGFFDEGRAAPFGFGFADAEEEIAEEFGAAFGVVYFRRGIARRRFFARDLRARRWRCRCGRWRESLRAASRT